MMRREFLQLHRRVINEGQIPPQSEQQRPAPILSAFKYWRPSRLGQTNWKRLIGKRPNTSSRSVHTTTHNTKVLRRVDLNEIMAQKEFGLLFDIDGVLLRGKEPIDVAAEAMQMIYKVNSSFLFFGD